MQYTFSEKLSFNTPHVVMDYLQDAYDSTKVDDFFNRAKFFSLLEGDDKIISAIKNKTIKDLEKVWEEEVKSYLKILEKYKLYDQL